MAELLNCPNCGGLFVKANLRDVCDKCHKEEEKQFETVYKFIRLRQNRTATLTEVVDGTGVDEELIIKFIRSGRLQLAQFPNLGYPCQKCRTLIREGKLCDTCSVDLRKQINTLEKEEERMREISERDKRTYFSGN